MTEPEDRDISFEEAVEQCMRALGVTREQARAELRNAMLTGALPFLVEDPVTGDLDPGRPEEAKFCNDAGILDADYPRNRQ